MIRSQLSSLTATRRSSVSSLCRVPFKVPSWMPHMKFSLVSSFSLNSLSATADVTNFEQRAPEIAALARSTARADDPKPGEHAEPCRVDVSLSKIGPKTFLDPST